MKFLVNIVFCLLCVPLTLSVKSTYRAAVVTPNKEVNTDRLTSIISEAAKSNVDILVLPSLQTSASEYLGQEYYGEAVKTIANAAKQGGLYVVAHLLEKTLCQNRHELVRSNLVFDRQGDIVSEYRKPVDNNANCTTASADVSSFTTDFGVTFGLLMEEDIVLQSLERVLHLKNYVVAGAWSSEIPFLSASQFSSSWAYVTNANLISSDGIFAGNTGPTAAGAGVVVAELKNDGGLDKPMSAPIVNPAKHRTFPGEDLSQYIIRPLDVESSIRGYTETVCHGEFCCEFKVKTSSKGSTQKEVGYGLAAFNGVRHFGGSHNIGAQTCAVVACAGLYKRSCVIGSENNSTETNFEKITVTANFTSTNSAQFPVIVTADNSPAEFKLVRKSTTVTAEITDCQNLLSFGIFGRDFGKDFEDYVFGKDSATDGLMSDVYDYLYSEDVQEFFDYVWIRLRIMIVVVSIYVLEML